MNSKEVIEIIETICDKLGIAINSFSDFVPELVKYRVSSSVFWIVSSLLIIVASVVVIRYTVKRASKIYAKEHHGGRMDFYDFDDFPSVYVSSIVGGILAFIFLFVLLFNLRRIVVWTISPQASAVDYVLSYFK